MAYAPQRSLTDELESGLTELSYKTVVRGRGGFVEDITPRKHADLSYTLYGNEEATTKIDPFGRRVTTSNTKPGSPERYLG